MKLEEAIEILKQCHRTILEDKCFKDIKVFWMKNLNSDYIAKGYFSESKKSITILDNNNWTQFKDKEADILLYCFKSSITTT